MKLTIPAETARLPEVTAFVDDFLDTVDCPLRARMKFDLCVEEIFVNIASYAYPPGVKGLAQIEIGEQNGVVTVVFSDSGIYYDPLKKEDPDVTLPAAQRRIGGLGIFLVKKNMDSVEYVRDGDRNILTIRLDIGRRPAAED
ncbi:MAG: ATP-binding protein [Clostridia bacterium]|nr:ATP-binding protein [Clostridia bacterium]